MSTDTYFCGTFAGEPVPAVRKFVDIGNSNAYDAITPRGRRKDIAANHRSEDDILRTGDRSKILAAARDITRNFSLAQWAISQHLNYVASFRFHALTPDEAFNADVERLVAGWSSADQFDVRGQHGLRPWLRLSESSRTIDGDVGVARLVTGHVQGIESDRIRNADDSVATAFPGKWVHGVRLDDAGRAVDYAVHKREAGMFEFERVVPAKNMRLLGYYRRFDQVRGVSLFASGMNALRDVYENIDHAQARAKVSHLFALMFERAAVENPEELGDYSEVDLTKGPAVLDMNPGDKASFLESRQPSAEFQDFMQICMMLALRALDLPFSFLREDFTNFFGSRAAQMHYERSCRHKREGLQDLLTWLTAWRIALWVLDGTLVLPRTLSIAQLLFGWVPVAMPWWDPAKEATGDLKAIQAGLGNPLEMSLERTGRTFADNVEAIASAIAIARKAGVRVAFDPEQGPLGKSDTNSDPNATPAE